MSAMSTKRYMQEYSLQHYSYYPQTNKKTLKSRTDKLYHTIEYHIPVKNHYRSTKMYIKLIAIMLKEKKLNTKSKYNNSIY